MASASRVTSPALHPPVVSADVIGLAYEAVLDPSRWTVFLDALARALDAQAAALVVRRHTDGQRVDDWLRAVPVPQEPFAQLPERDLAAMACQPRDTSMEGAAADLLWQHCGLPSAGPARWWIIENRPGVLMLLGVASRDARVTGDPSGDSLLPHLRRALHITMRLEQTERQARSLAAILRQAHLGIALVDAESNLVWRNAGAREVMQREIGVRAIGGRICFTDPSVQRRYADLLSASRHERHPAVVNVSCNGCGGDWPVAVHPLEPDLQGGAWALVFPLTPTAPGG